MWRAARDGLYGLIRDGHHGLVHIGTATRVAVWVTIGLTVYVFRRMPDPAFRSYVAKGMAWLLATSVRLDNTAWRAWLA